MAHVHWATAARLLPLLLASRTAGPTFLVYRRPRVPSLSTLQHLGRYVRLLEETSARITADHDPAAIRRRSAMELSGCNPSDRQEGPVGAWHIIGTT